MFRVDRPVMRQAKRILPQPVKELAGHGLRGFGMATSPWRSLPDFLVIGSKRCGSTSLFTYLLDHPDVAPLFPAAQGRKGAHYFDRNPDRSLTWYRSHFRLASNRHRTCGEASTYYFCHPYAPQRAAALVPAAKMIALLREPAERAFSQYRDEVKNGHEHLGFAQAIAAEPARIEPELARMRADPHYYSVVHEHLSYLSWGRYAEHLGRWLEHYPAEQLLVLRSEDMFADPGAVYRKVTDFLGLSPHSTTFRRHNDAPSGPRDEAVMEQLRRYYEPHNERLRQLLRHAPSWE